MNEIVREIPSMLNDVLFHTGAFSGRGSAFQEVLRQTRIIYGQLYVKVLNILTQIVSWFAEPELKKCMKGILKDSNAAAPLNAMMKDIRLEYKEFGRVRGQAQVTGIFELLDRDYNSKREGVYVMLPCEAHLSQRDSGRSYGRDIR